MVVVVGTRIMLGMRMDGGWLAVGGRRSCLCWYDVLQYDYLPMTEHADKHDLVYWEIIRIIF